MTDRMPGECNNDNDVAVVDDSLDMKTASEKNIMVHYFNIGGLPEKVYKAFKNHCRHSRMFHRPEDMPQSLLNELSGI